MNEQTQQDFETILTKFSPEVQEIARAARTLILDVLPVVVEVPWVHQGTIGYGTGPKKMSEQFAYIAAQKNHVNLGFYYGSELPDPDNLLEGTGKLLRHIKLRSVADVQRPAVRALLEFAKSHRVPPPKSS